MADFKPYLQINTSTFFYTTYQAVSAIINRSDLEVSDLVTREIFEELPKHLLLGNKNIGVLLNHLEKLSDILNESKLAKRGKAVLETTTHIFDTVKRSGLGGEEIKRWLEDINREKFDELRLELQEIENMQYELLWLIKKAVRSMSLIRDEDIIHSSFTFKELAMLTKQLQKNLDNAWKSYEKI